MAITHEQWVAWGDVAESVKDWAYTALGALIAATAGASLGFTVFLLLLNKIGNLT
jgi:hypothetical protein